MFGVYPRVCGGTPQGGEVMGIRVGLSPRVRGNRSVCTVTGRTRGSIPACAGEPVVCPRGATGRGVYPRVCGGTGFL